MQKIQLQNRVTVAAIATALVLLAATGPAVAQSPLAQPATERTAVLAEWESLKYGMFIHFGLSTFVQEEYLPMETEDCLTEVWFHTGKNKPKPLEWRLQRYDEVVGRGANWLLDVAPDQTGRIPQDQVEALLELKQALDSRAKR